MRRIFMAVVVILAAVWLMLPLTNHIRTEQHALKYGGANVNRKMRLDLGQGMAIALLAGFRGVVSDFLWIQAHWRWELKQWLRQYQDMKLAVTLQPQSTLFWETGAWHMAWNIGYAVSVDTNVYTEAQGLKRQREWWDRAEEFLKRGIENVPNRYDLYFSLAWLYTEKFKDFCLAEEYFAKAAAFKEAPSYIARMHARAQEKCGDLKGAYAYWVNLWTQDHTKVDQNWSVVEREIRRIEDLMNTPDNLRLFPRKPADAKPAPQ